jgi:hypothetical protein
VAYTTSQPWLPDTQFPLGVRAFILPSFYYLRVRPPLVGRGPISFGHSSNVGDRAKSCIGGAAGEGAGRGAIPPPAAGVAGIPAPAFGATDLLGTAVSLAHCPALFSWPTRSSSLAVGALICQPTLPRSPTGLPLVKSCIGGGGGGAAFDGAGAGGVVDPPDVSLLIARLFPDRQPAAARRLSPLRRGAATSL